MSTTIGTKHEASSGPEPRPERLRRWVVLAHASGAATIGLTGVIALATGHAFAYFSQEPSKAVRIHGCEGVDCAYAGLLANIGFIALSVAATACLLVALAVREPSRRMRASPLLWFGLLALLLLLDDMFQIHEYGLFGLLPNGEPVVVAVYALAAGLFLVRFRDFLRRGPYGLLLASFVLFGASLLFDEVLASNLVEDGTKFIGIVSFATYALTISITALHDPARQPT